MISRSLPERLRRLDAPKSGDPATGRAAASVCPEAGTHGDEPLGLVIHLVPDPLPDPLDQGVSCQGGGDLIVRLKSGRWITYGPCSWPSQIAQLWGAMIEASVLRRRANP